MSYNTRGYGATTYRSVGDPFLGGLIKGVGKVAGGLLKTAGGIVPGPVGGVLGTVGGIIAPSRPSAYGALTIPPISISGSLPAFPGAPTVGLSLPQGYTPGFPGGGAMGAAAGGAVKPSGYHLNKSGYFLKTGAYVAPGTRWVRNRRMNAANGRALRRSIRRAKSFDNLVKRNRKNLRSLARI